MAPQFKDWDKLRHFFLLAKGHYILGNNTMLEQAVLISKKTNLFENPKDIERETIKALSVLAYYAIQEKEKPAKFFGEMFLFLLDSSRKTVEKYGPTVLSNPQWLDDDLSRALKENITQALIVQLSDYDVDKEELGKPDAKILPIVKE